MSYEPTTWKTGDVITSAKLNHMEDGIAAAHEMIYVGSCTLNLSVLNGTLDKTWQEIFDAVSNGNICYFTATQEDNEYAKKIFIITEVNRDEEAQHPYVVSTVDEYELKADSPTQCPTTESSSDPT